MTEDVASLDEGQQVGTLFGTTAEELRIAAIGSKIEFAKSELQTVQAYIDVVYAGKIAVTTDDGIELPADPLAHPGSVLSNYEQARSTKLWSLNISRRCCSSRRKKTRMAKMPSIADHQTPASIQARWTRTHSSG